MSFLPRFDLPKPDGRVAVLVDAESIPLAAVSQILATAHGLGDLVVRRAYGSAARLQDWAEAPGFRVIRAGGGRQATALLIGTEAMALMLTRKADTLVIASVARDFAAVVAELRERGHNVVGIGLETSPLSFRQACREFVDLVPVRRVRMVRVVPQGVAA